MLGRLLVYFTTLNELLTLANDVLGRL